MNNIKDIITGILIVIFLIFIGIKNFDNQKEKTNQYNFTKSSSNEKEMVEEEFSESFIKYLKSNGFTDRDIIIMRMTSPADSNMLRNIDEVVAIGENDSLTVGEILHILNNK